MDSWRDERKKKEEYQWTRRGVTDKCHNLLSPKRKLKQRINYKEIYILDTEKGEEKEEESISARSSMGSKTVVMARNPWDTRVSENYLKLGKRQKEITGNPFSKGLGLAFYCLDQFMTPQRNRLTCRCLFGRIGN